MSVLQDAPAQPAAPRRRRHATSLGALANTGASALRLACQLALLPILARLIGPSEYGLVALAMPVILFANVIADGGLAAALGRLPSASRTVESTVFWVTLAAGAGLALAACAAAFPIGWLLHHPRLPWLILALSPILLMNSATSVWNGRIIRERRFATFAMGDVLGTLGGAVTALLAATHGFGAWSLVAQQLALWICKFLWLTTRGGAQVGFVFRFSEVRELVRFGLNNMGATLADFLSRNADNMIIGGVLGATVLGYYAMAYQLIRMPDMLLSGPFWFYIFTAISRTAHREDPDGIRRLAHAGLRLGAAALAPLFCGLALVADLLAGLLLGREWHGVIAPLRLLSVAGFGFCMCSIMGAMLMGLGRSALQFRLSGALALATIVTVAGAVHFGLEMTAAALACGVLLVALYYVDRLASEIRASRLSLLRTLIPTAVASAALIAAVIVTRRLLDVPPLALLTACVLTGAVAYLAVLWTLARHRLLSDARAFAKAHADIPAAPAAPASEDAAPSENGLAA